MGKIFVLSVTDHEEYILSRIMEIIAAEPGFDHIVSSHPCNTLVFPGLELRLKERTVHRNGELKHFEDFRALLHAIGNLRHWYTWQTTRPGYFLPGRFMKKCGVRMVKTAEQPLPASLVRSAEN